MTQAWHYFLADKKMGPFTAAQIRELAAKGTIKPDTLVLRDDMQNAIPAAAVKGLCVVSDLDKPKRKAKSDETKAHFARLLMFVLGAVGIVAVHFVMLENDMPTNHLGVKLWMWWVMSCLWEILEWLRGFESKDTN